MNFLDKILDMIQVILPWLVVFGIFKLMEKRNKKKIEEHEQEKADEYIITNHKELLWLFVLPAIIFSAVLIYGIIDGQGQIVIVIGFLFFIGALVTAALNAVVWKVEVKGDCIEYRSTFGITRHYNFNEITRGVYKKSGAMRVYVGEKRIFTFDDNVDFSSFEYQMDVKGIPVIEYDERRGDNFVVRPATRYYVLSVILLIVTGGLAVLIFWQTNQWTGMQVLMMGLAVCSAIALLDFVMDRAWIKDGNFHRRRLLKKTVDIPVRDISGTRLKKNLFRENLVLYQGEKRIASVWTMNDGVNWIEAKIREEKRKKKKLEQKSDRKK